MEEGHPGSPFVSSQPEDKNENIGIIYFDGLRLRLIFELHFYKITILVQCYFMERVFGTC